MPKTARSFYDEMVQKGVQLATDVPHALFVESVEEKTIMFEITYEKKYKLLTKTHKIIFNTLVAMYLVVPLIVVPILSYSYGKPLMLFGIALSYLGSFITAKHSKIGILLTLVLLGWLASIGFHHKSYPTFFIIWFWWGSMLFAMADGAESEYLKKQVMQNPDLYDALAESEQIILIMNPHLEKSV